MIDPGRLNRRLTLQAPDERDDGQGGVVRDYATAAVLWAQVAPLPARDQLIADSDTARSRLRLTLRGGIALSRRHLFVDGAQSYRIIGWRTRDNGALLEVDVEQQLS